MKTSSNADAQSKQPGAPVSGRVPAGRILIVDDDAISREMARHILDRHQFPTIVAESSKEAQRILANETPSLVLMDIHLGQANGIALVTALRKGLLCANPNVPVIYVTSDCTPDTASQAIGPKIQGYILKPYVPALLIQKVREVLGQKPNPPAASGGRVAQPQAT